MSRGIHIFVDADDWIAGQLSRDDIVISRQTSRWHRVASSRAREQAVRESRHGPRSS
jgi:hypothetical protein